MTYKEQIEWLVKNGFEEIPNETQNIFGISVWEKPLQGTRNLIFSLCKDSRWVVSISELNGIVLEAIEIWLFSLPEDQDFNFHSIQGLVDLIK